MIHGETETVHVAFLIDRNEEVGQVVAVMPGLAGTIGRRNHCVCYIFNGQHSVCDLNAMTNHYDQATHEEYADLKAELEGAGYIVCVIGKDRIHMVGYECERADQLGR